MAALLSLLTSSKPFRTKMRTGDDTSDILLIDVTTKITPEFTAETTDLPVEAGIDVTDHVRLKPIIVQVTGVISETPLTLASELQGLVTAAGSLVGGLLGGFGSSVGAVAGGAIGASILTQGDGNTNPAIAARKILENMWSSKQLFTLVDKYRKYQNMIITSLTFPRDNKTGHKLEFSFSAKQITLVTAQETQISKISSKIAHSASKTNKLGTQTGVADTGNNGSVLYKGLKGLGFSL